MGLGSGAATAAAVLAVVTGALLLGGPAAEAPTAPLVPAAEATTAPLVPAAEVTTARLRPAATARVEYGWPSGQQVEVLRAFAPPVERWAVGHRGVDLAMSHGDAVRAAADGVVAFAGPVAGRGVVSVDHADGVRTTYEPVAAVVGRGDVVTGGQVLGHLDGVGHCAPATCLHWGARRGSEDYLDPLGLVRQEVVIRLLPRHGR